MILILEAVLSVFAGLLLADFASGFIHWIIDRYIPGNAPGIGRHFVGLIHEHHERPHAMFQLSVVRANAGFVILVSGVFLIFWALHWLNMMTISAFVFGACANIVHGWAHKRPKHFARTIRLLQGWGVLQSPRHHGQHHGPSPVAYYCLITNWVNPVVDRIQLWRRAEQALAIFGLHPQPYVKPNPNYLVPVS